MEHHFDIVIMFLFCEHVVQEAANVVSHGTCEVESIKIGMINIWKISELLPERAGTS